MAETNLIFPRKLYKYTSTIIINQTVSQITVDTGADSTLLRLSNLIVDNTIRARVKYKIKVSRELLKYKKSLYSASGSQIDVICCYAEDVLLGDVILQKLYFVLDYNDLKSNNLLGMDFIVCSNGRYDKDAFLVDVYDCHSYCAIHPQDTYINIKDLF